MDIARAALNRSVSVGQRHVLPTGRVVFHVKREGVQYPAGTERPHGRGFNV